MKNSGNNSSFLKNSYEVGLEMHRDTEESKNNSLSKMKLRIVDSIEGEKRGRVQHPSKNSKRSSNNSSPSNSLRKLKTNLMNEKLSTYIKKNRLDDSVDYEPIIRGFPIEPIKELNQEHMLTNNPKKQFSVELQASFTLEAVDVIDRVEFDEPIDDTKLTEENRKLFEFVRNNYGVELTEKTSLPLSSIFEIFDQYLKNRIKEKEESWKNNEDIKKMRSIFDENKARIHMLEQNFISIEREKEKYLKETNKLKLRQDDLKKSISMNEKENVLLKTDLVSSIKAKKNLAQKMKNDNKIFKEMLDSLADNLSKIE